MAEAGFEAAFALLADPDVESLDCGRGFDRAVPPPPVDFDDAGPADELLDDAEPLEAAEPPVSAEATAGIDAIAAPTPRAIAEAPNQVNNRSWPDDPDFGVVMPPNSAGSIRRAPLAWVTVSSRSIELIGQVPPVVAIT
ncbi:hypothetical protein BayCH28_20885 [Mycolicibacterium sp. CH28]|uniref:hypothetical protein n=1 Tax=Mycolicibacterium sp. CH28 TaxID=2512237 RepID=UPI0010800C63|nr:hypothetical protein [Mycolicibacterium sp. CH28]TGD85486.1 hypothetical protein BayCH28_20885 [Mycolicibacterium sp. CH28]